MTSEEFNKKYEQYLEERHYGLAISHPKVVEYLDKEFQELIKIPGFQYSQIKMKFGSTRFYSVGLPDGKDTEIEERINELIKLEWKEEE